MLAQNTYLHHLVALFVIYTQVHHHEQVRKTEIEKAIRSLVEEFDQAQVNQVAPAWETSAGVTKFPSIVRQFFQDYRVSQAGVALHKYLLALQNSGRLPATVKNYRSDIGQFLNFAPAKSPDQLVQKSEVARFLEFEQQRGSSQATIHRKVASLSQFFQWLQENGWLTTNLWKSFSSTSFSELLKTDKPVRELTTLSDQTDERPAAWSLPLKNIDIQAYLPQQFQNSLARAVKKTPVLTRLRKAISAQPLLGYFNLAMGIIFFLGAGFLGYRQFFSETSSSLAFPTSLTRPNRSLSFQGRLTSATRSPITSITPMRFKLYDSGPATGSGNLLWDSNSCNIDPDQDGIFSTTLGDACGTEITSDVFTEHSNVWLEVQVNSEILAPRQSIKTVAYALNSETLQGYPASASAVENTVVIMRNDGKVVFGNANPILEATGDSFTLTANTLTLETSSGSNGDVIINPDGTGQTLINSNTIIDGYLYAPGATLSATYAGGTALTLKAGPSATGDIMQWQSSAGSPLGVIDKSGNIGIGTTVARASLEIAGTASSSGTLTFKGTTDPKIDILNGESFGLRTSVGGDVGLTERLTILNNGNIGIGSTTPSQVLDVVGGIRLGAADAENVLNTSTAGGAPSGNLYWGDRTVCDSTGNCSTVDSNWSIAGGSIYPKNTTLDMFIGGIASASAKFAFLNVNSGIPTASIAGNLALAAPTGADPATKLNVYNGGSFGLRTSVGGDAGLAERLTVLNNGNVGIGTTSPVAKLEITDSSSITSLGSEMITNADDRTFASDLSHWSGTNWSIGSGVATHTAGANAYTLSNTYLTSAPEASAVYLVKLTATTTTTGTLTISFGGTTAGVVGYSTGTIYPSYVVVATNTNPLTITPNTAWEGSIDNVSIKKYTTFSSVALQLNQSDGNTAPIQFRTGANNGQSLFIGNNSGQYANTYEVTDSVAIGTSTLRKAQEYGYVAIGANALQNVTDGAFDNAVGMTSLGSLITGYHNNAMGYQSLYALKTGSNNTAIGGSIGSNNFNGIFNTENNSLFGFQAAHNLGSNSTNNVILGMQAGYNIDSGSNNIFLGYQAGYNETGSNKLYIDNSNTSSPLIWGDFASNYINVNGNLGIGSTAPSQKLDVVGGIRLGTADAENVLNTSTAGGAPSGNLYWGDRTVCDSTGNCSVVDSNWTVGSGIIYPKNATLDMFIGGTASSSAKFAFLNVNSGTPTASIAGNLALAAPTGADPATKLNVYNGGSFGLRTSVGGDAGLTERLTILNNGNVGIGTTNPVNILDVNGTVNTNSSSFYKIGNNKIIDIENDGTLLVGVGAGLILPSGVDYNTLIGASAGASINNSAADGNTMMGYLSGNQTTTGSINTYIGKSSGYAHQTSYGNVFVGESAGSGFSIMSSANYNTGVGSYSLQNISGGSDYNQTFGAQSGYYLTTTSDNNVFIGNKSGYGVSYYYGNSSNNTFVGSESGYSIGNNQSNNIFIGYQAGYNETGSNKLYIDSSNTSTPLIWGDFASDYVNINGNLGIGSTAPSQKLDVVGGIRLGAADAENVLNTSTAGGAPSGNLYWGDRTVCDSTGNCSTVDSNWTVGSGIIYPKNATLDMFIGGTASSSAKFAFLNVNSGTPTASIAGNLALAAPTGANPATKLNIYNGGSYGIQTSVGGDASLTERLTILNNGNVGIGTTVPTEHLALAGGNLLHAASGNPTLIDTYDTSGNALDVFVAGKYAYVADGAAGLHIFDISDPTSIALMGTYNTGGSAEGVYVAGKYAYVADGSAGLVIVDVSNPYAPTLVSSYNTTGTTHDVFVSGRYAYVADWTNGLIIFDISLLNGNEEPTIVGGYDTDNYTRSVYVLGKYAYLADVDQGLVILDISSPIAPAYISNVGAGYGAVDVYVSGRFAYLVNAGTLQIWDVADPATPSLKDSGGGSNVNAVKIAGDYAYLASQLDGIQIVDISDPNAIVDVGSNDTGGNSKNVFVAGKYAYVADDSAGLLVLDINGTKTPSLYAGIITANSADISESLLVGQSLVVRNGINVNNGLQVNGATSIRTNGIATAGSSVSVFSVGADGTPYLQISEFEETAEIYLGQTLANDGTYLSIEDSIKQANLVSTGTILLGDYNGEANSTLLTIDNPNQNFVFANGNVGIGSTAPSQKLDVVGAIRLGAVGANNILNTTIAGGAPSGNLYWGNRTVCDSSGSCGGSGTWTIGSGIMYPINNTVDVLIGGVASTSAKFAFLNVNGGSPTASIAGNLSLVVPTGSTPATKLNIFNGGTLSIQNSVGGDAGLSTSFSVSPAQITSVLPHQFTAAGDVSIAYDLIFTNQTSSEIQTNGPFTIKAGESWENNNLTLSTYGSGNLLANLGDTGKFQITSADPSIILDTKTATDTDFWLGVQEDAGGDDDDIFSIGDGTTIGTNSFFSINTAGNVGIGSTAPSSSLEVAGSIELANYLYFGNSTSEYLRWDGSDFLVSDDFLPNANDSLNLGATGARWADLYLGPETLHIGSTTSDEGTISYDTTGDIFNFGTDSTTNGDIAFFTDDLYLDKASGNVGIGSTTPSQVLDVVGGIRLGAADAENVLHTTVAGGAPSGNLYWGDRTVCDSTGNCGGGSSNWTLGAGFIHPINPSVDLFIGGTASASAKFAFLNVNSGIPTASIAGNLALAAPTGASPANKLNVYNGGSFGLRTSVGGDAGLTERLTVLNNGNVGIGTTGPGYKLEVAGNTKSNSYYLTDTWNISSDASYLRFNSGITGQAYISLNGQLLGGLGSASAPTFTQSSSLNTGMFFPSSSELGFTISGSEKVRIISSGNVGIGTTNPLKLLDVRGSATISGTLQLAPNVAVNAGTCNASAKGTQYYNGTDNKMYYCNGTAWTAMGVGDVKLETFTGDGTYTPTSDTVLTIVEAIGPGGGGGGGGSIATGTARTGGGGGGGGAYTTKTFSAANVTPNVSIVVPTGGVGGNGGTNAAGSDGAAASADTSFGSLLVAYKGGGGGNGTVTTTLAGGGGGGGSGAAGTSSTNQTGQAGGGPGGGAAGASVDGLGGGGGGTAATGGNSSWGGGGGGGSRLGGTAGDAGGSSLRGGGGGGGGGSCAASCTSTNGGAGGNVPGATAGGGGAAGSGGGGGGNGTDNATGIGGDGGGGGGSNQTAGSSAGAGGNGGAPGGGGGGGGAATYSSTGTGGKGGDGGRGEVRVWSVKGSGADYAELYSSHDVTLEPGDVVALDSSLKAGVKKSTSPYENGLLGIISTLPGQVVGSVDDQAEKVVIVALAGRVPTKVSTENGPIKAGDFLTASSIPGVAMKATSVGLTVGTAIEDYNGAVGEVGNISVFVNTTYTSGLLLKQVLASHGVEIPESVWRSNTIDYSWYVLATMLEKQEEIKNKPILTETYVDRLVAGLELITPRLVTQSTYTNEVHALPGSDLNFYLPETSKLSIRKEQIEGSPPDLTELFSFDSSGNASVSGTLVAQSLRAETIDGLLFNSSGELLLNKSDEDFQVTPIGGSALTKVIGAAKAVIGRIQAGAINAQELLVSGQAYINNLSVNDFSINGQSLRDYVVSIIQENQATNPVIAEVSPTPAPTGTASGSAWLAAIFQQDQDTGQPIVENLNVSDTLSVEAIEVASVSAQLLEVSGQTMLGSLLINQNASVAGVFTTNELDANSARIDALEAGMAQFDSVRATTAEFANATISGTLYAETITDLDKQIAELLGQPALMDVITGNIPSPQNDFSSLYQVLGSISSTASQAGQLNQSVADLNLADDDVVLDASAGFIDRYFKVNGVAYVGDSLGVGNTLRVGQKLELTDTYLSFSTGADTPDESPIFFIQPSGKGLLALMGGLMTLDETGQVTINGNLHVAGDVSVEGSLLANVIEPLNQGESLKLNLGPSNTGLEATMAGTLASPSGQLEVLGDAGTPVATVSAQGKASFSSLSLGRDLLARPSVAGAATESSQLTQEATQTTGRATLPAGNRDLIIRNPYVRRDSLIYLTPLNSTNNQVLYVNHIEAPADEATAQANDERSFTVSLDNVTASDISFTWWIVN